MRTLNFHPSWSTPERVEFSLIHSSSNSARKLGPAPHPGNVRSWRNSLKVTMSAEENLSIIYFYDRGRTTMPELPQGPLDTRRRKRKLGWLRKRNLPRSWENLSPLKAVHIRREGEDEWYKHKCLLPTWQTQREREKCACCPNNTPVIEYCSWRTGVVNS